MWVWDDDMQRLGFRRRSERYWQCERRHGLGANGHLSVFSWSEQAIPVCSAHRFLVELTEFHVTFALGREHVHFYYHEHHDNEWERGGHTSAPEILYLGCDPAELRGRADAMAAALIGALGGVLRPP